MKKFRVFCTCMLCTLSVLMLPALGLSSAHAIPAVPEIPNAIDTSANFSGNAFDAGKSVLLKGSYDRDVYAAGEVVSVIDSRVAESIIMAGKDLSVSNTELGGSLRLAAQNISVDDTQARGNATVACMSYSSNENSVIDGTVICFSKDATIAGKVGSVIVYGNDVIIDGEVSGDVLVTAERVSFGPHANVSGLATVNAKDEPLVDPNATVSDIQYTHIETDDDEEAGAALLGALGGLSILSIIFGLFTTAVCAILIELVFRRATAGSARMVRERTAPMLVSGLVAAIVMPIALLLALCLVVTMPLAGAGLFAMIAITILAGAFTAASLSKLVLPKMNRVLSALIGGLVIGICSSIPVIGWIVSICCIMYMLGYIVQCTFLGMIASERIDGQHGTESGPDTPSYPEAPFAKPAVAPDEISTFEEVVIAQEDASTDEPNGTA